jgi:hypothetical protein
MVAVAAHAEASSALPRERLLTEAIVARRYAQEQLSYARCQRARVHQHRATWQHGTCVRTARTGPHAAGPAGRRAASAARRTARPTRTRTERCDKFRCSSASECDCTDCATLALCVSPYLAVIAAPSLWVPSLPRHSRLPVKAPHSLLAAAARALPGTPFAAVRTPVADEGGAPLALVGALTNSCVTVWTSGTIHDHHR